MSDWWREYEGMVEYMNEMEGEREREIARENLGPRRYSDKQM